MFLQGAMFAKGLPTAWDGTFVFLATLVCGEMSFQPCVCEKLFIAAFPITGVVSDVCMGRLDMVLEVGFAKEILCTRGMGTDEWTGVCVRAEMFCESGWSIE